MERDLERIKGFCATQPAQKAGWNKKIGQNRLRSMALPTGVEPVFSD